MTEDTPSRPRRDFLSWGVLALVLVLVALWPGDVSWLMDEPRLIGTAWHANHDGHLAMGGLYGNFGVRYGPLPTQMYQLLLLLTHNPYALVVLHALLLAGVTGGALLWLARTLELPGWLAVGVLLSPHMVAYQRVLWDASFAMPVGTIALASFADFIKTRRAWSLRVCLLASVLVPTIHPQALPLAVAILGWLGWRHRADLWRDRKALGVVGGAILLFNGFYFVQFAGQVIARLGGSVQKGYPGGASHTVSALAPFLGGRLLSGADYLRSLARPSAPEWLHHAAQFGANCIYPLAWLGVLGALHGTWRAMRRKDAEMTPREIVTVVVLCGLGLQALLFGLMRIPSAPQYFFGTVVLHAVVAALAVDFLRCRCGVVLGVVYVLSAAGLSLEAAWSIHQHGFERPRWPTLTSSVEAVRELNQYAPEVPVVTDVALYQKAPQALRTLRLLLPPEPGPKIVPEDRARVLISFDDRDADQPLTIEVSTLFRDMKPWPEIQPIDVSPLPRDWVPDPSTW